MRGVAVFRIRDLPRNKNDFPATEFMATPPWVSQISKYAQQSVAPWESLTNQTADLSKREEVVGDALRAASNSFKVVTTGLPSWVFPVKYGTSNTLIKDVDAGSLTHAF